MEEETQTQGQTDRHTHTKEKGASVSRTRGHPASGAWSTNRPSMVLKHRVYLWRGGGDDADADAATPTATLIPPLRPRPTEDKATGFVAPPFCLGGSVSSLPFFPGAGVSFPPCSPSAGAAFSFSISVFPASLLPLATHTHTHTHTHTLPLFLSRCVCVSAVSRAIRSRCASTQGWRCGTSCEDTTLFPHQQGERTHPPHPQTHRRGFACILSPSRDPFHVCIPAHFLTPCKTKTKPKEARLLLLPFHGGNSGTHAAPTTIHANRTAHGRAQRAHRARG